MSVHCARKQGEVQYPLTLGDRLMLGFPFSPNGGKSWRFLVIYALKCVTMERTAVSPEVNMYWVLVWFTAITVTGMVAPTEAASVPVMEGAREAIDGVPNGPPDLASE